MVSPAACSTAPFVSAVPGLELTAIVQRKGDEAAQAYPNARILRSTDEAFSDPAIDLIVVATPNETHLELATQALRAGKHVVVDKPLAGSATDARALADLARTQGKQLIPFHNRRWDGDFLTLQQLLASGSLGRVTEIRSRFDRFRPVQRAGTWKEAASPMHGLLYDLGPHVVDQALVLFGAPDRLSASVRRDRDHTDIADAFDITLHYYNLQGHALRFHCGGTMLAAEPAPRYVVHGTHGSYTKHGVDPQEPTLVANSTLRPPTLDTDATTWLAEPTSAWGTLTLAPNPAEPGILNRTPHPTLPGDYRLFYAGVRNALTHGTPPPVSAEDAVYTIHLLDLALESSRQGCTLPVAF